MKYRMYPALIKASTLVLVALNLAACASSGVGTQTQQEAKAEQASRYDGREPSSLKGNISWLNDVEDDFGRIADETSSRAVASQNAKEVLMKEKDWSFSFLPKTNNFSIEVQGTAYKMMQTRINDGNRFAFAAEGQAENPITFAVAKSDDGRIVASEGGASCDTDIAYWSKTTKAYVSKRISVHGKACERMLTLLEDYVP